MTTKINFNKSLITADNPACCSAGLETKLNVSNLVPFKEYIVDYSSIGPGAVQFSDTSIIFTASNDTREISNIVYLEGSINYVIKAKISRIEEDNTLTVLSEDVLGIDCVELPPIRPTPTVTATVTQTPTITPTRTPTNTPTASITPSVTPSVSLTPSITPSISVTPTITPTLSLTPTNTATPTNTQTPTTTVSATPSPTPTESPTPTSTISPTPTTSVTPTIGMPKVYLTFGPTETCGSNELVLYVDIKGLIPDTTYKYALNTANDFDCYPTMGQFTTQINSGSALVKHFLIYNKKFSTKNSCNTKNYGATFSLYYGNDQIISTTSTNIVCDSSDCDCPKFTISAAAIAPTMPLNRVTPTPTRTPSIIPIVIPPDIDELSNYPNFICPDIITKRKIGDNNIFIIDTLTEFEYEIVLDYSFFGSPERLKVETFVRTSDKDPCDPCGRTQQSSYISYKTLYDSGFVGSVERYPNNNNFIDGVLSGSPTTNGPYVFCPGLERRQHEFGSYDRVVFKKPLGSRYLVCSIISGCDQSSEWRASFSCSTVPTPTPTRTCTPTLSVTPSNTPTLTPSATAAVCSYRFDNFDSNRGVSKNCKDIKDIDSAQYISVDKPISVISIANSLIVVGSSACNDASYILPSRKIALTKIRNNSVDETFGLSGKIIHAAKNDAGINTNIDAKKIIPQTNKFIVISESDTQIVISRHLVVSGFLDISFGLGGFVYIQAPQNYRILDFGDAIVTGNRLLVALNTYDTLNRKYMVSLCSLNTSTGYINTAFGLNGFYHVDAGLGGSKYSIQKIDVVQDKPIVVAQNKDQEGINTIIAIRFTDNGQIDQTFYNSGILRIGTKDIVGASEDIIPELSNVLINKDGLYLSVVYKSTNTYEIFKYGYTGGKISSWKNTITFPPAINTVIDTKYDASVYDSKTNSWYVGYNLLNQAYADNADLDLVERNGPVTIKGSSKRHTRILSDKYLECNDVSYKQVPYNIGDNIDVEFIQKSYQFIVAKHDLTSNTTQIIGSGKQLTEDGLGPNLVSSMIIVGDALYLIGFGGDQYNYSFLMTKWNNFNIIDNTFGQKGYMTIDFDSLCTDDEDDTPPLVEDSCDIGVTPTPTPGFGGPALSISSVQFLCLSTKPILRANINISKATVSDKQYLLRLRKDQSQLSTTDTTIPSGATTHSVDIDLSTVNNSEINQICQVELLDVENGLSVVASRVTALAKPICN